MLVNGFFQTAKFFSLKILFLFKIKWSRCNKSSIERKWWSRAAERKRDLRHTFLFKLRLISTNHKTFQKRCYFVYFTKQQCCKQSQFTNFKKPPTLLMIINRNKSIFLEQTVKQTVKQTLQILAKTNSLSKFMCK